MHDAHCAMRVQCNHDAVSANDNRKPCACRSWTFMLNLPHLRHAVASSSAVCLYRPCSSSRRCRACRWSPRLWAAWRRSARVVTASDSTGTDARPSDSCSPLCRTVPSADCKNTKTSHTHTKRAWFTDIVRSNFLNIAAIIQGMHYFRIVFCNVPMKPFMCLCCI